MTATIVIDDILPRTQATATSGQTIFDTNWTADVASDVVVYARAAGSTPNDGDDLIDPSNYNVTFVGGSEEVRVTFTVGRTAGDIVTIVRQTPADRQNLYSNTNFTPSMLNGDFGRELFMIQQNELINAELSPKYYNSAVIDQGMADANNYGGDVYLPVLGANEIWVKDANNNEITTITVSDDLLLTGLTYLTYTDETAYLPNSLIGIPSPTNGRDFEFTNGDSIVGSGGTRIKFTGTGSGSEHVEFNDSIISAGGTNPNPAIFIQSGGLSGTTIRQIDTSIGARLNLREAQVNGNEQVQLRAPDLIPSGYTITFPSAQGSINQAMINNGAGILSWTTVPSVTTPTTDNAVARYDGTSGAIQNSTVILDDAGGMYIPGTTTIGTNVAATNSTLTVQEGISTTNNMTDATIKIGNFQVPHYTNAEEPLTLIRGRTTSSVNEIMVGGGASLRNSATQVAFYTAANNTTLVGTERGRVDSSGNWLFNTTTNATNSQFNILSSTVGIVTATNNMTNSANKFGHFCVPHYTNSEEPVMIAGASIQSGSNIARFGGGSSSTNACTELHFYTASGSAITTGTERGRLDSSGRWYFNTTTAATNSAFNILNATAGIMTATNTMTDTASKSGIFATPHYANSEAPLLNIFGNTNSGSNLVFIGGGSSNANAATQIRLYTASSTTTLTGTERFRIDSSGDTHLYGSSLYFDSGEGIYGTSSAPFIQFTGTASSVGYIDLSSSGNPRLTLSGSGTNISMFVRPKGTGNLIVEGDTNGGGVIFRESTGTGSHGITFRAPASVTSSYSATFPDATPAAYDAWMFTSTSVFSWSSQQTSALKMPVGTTAQRPTAANGLLRYNSSNTQFEGSDASNWYAIPFEKTGTWTPVLEGSTVVGTNSYTTQSGTYNKQGKQVIIDFTITLDGSGGALASTGSLNITGIPFPSSSAREIGLCYATGVTLSGTNASEVSVRFLSASVLRLTVGTSGGGTNMTATMGSDSMSVRGSIVIQTT